MIHNTQGKEGVERASLAFVVGNTALSSGQEATVLLTIEGVWVATKGYAEGLQADGFEPLAALVQKFVQNNGRLWVCGACSKPRHITEADLVEGAQIIGAAAAVEALVNGAQTLSL
jgi:predicted peroxiredoxin